MELSLANVFYTLGIVLAILNLLFLTVVAIGSWYAYQFYQRTKHKVQSVPALFLAKKLINNPMRVGTGMMVVQLVGSVLKMLRGRKRAQAL